MKEFLLKTYQSVKDIFSPLSLLKLLLIFIAYFFTAKGGLSLNAVSGFATLVWPPTGIAIVALLVFGYRLWPSIFFAAFFINLFTGAAAPVAVGIAVGNTLEAVVATLLLQRFEFNLEMRTIKDALLFIFFGALCNTLVSATIGVSSLWLGGVVILANYPATWLAWWIGDMLGALIVGNLLLEYLHNK